MEPNEVRTRLVEDEQQDDEQSVEGHSMRLNLTDEAGPDGLKKVSRVDDADDEFDTEGHIRQL